MSWRNLSNLRELDASKHHSIAEGIKHVISPLSAMLLMYALAKYNLKSVFRATNNARAFARYYRRYGATPPPPTAPPPPSALSSLSSAYLVSPSSSAASVRSFSTMPAALASVRSFSTTPAALASVRSFSTTPAALASVRSFSTTPTALASVRSFSTTPTALASVRSFSSICKSGTFSTGHVWKTSSSVFTLTNFTACNNSGTFGVVVPSLWQQRRLVHTPVSPQQSTTASASATATTISSSSTAETASPALAETGGELHHEFSAFLSERHHALVDAVSVIYEPECVSTVLHHIYHLPPVCFFEQCLYSMHAALGTSWWLSIAATTLVLRVVTLPFNVSFLQHQLRIKKLKPRIMAANEVLEDPKAKTEAKLVASQTILSLQAQHHCSPYGMWVMPLIFPPVFLSYFAAISNISFAEPSLAIGGAAWFTDLMAEDPTSILPVCAALSWLAVVETGSGQMYARSGRLRVWARLTAIASIPIMSSLPSAVFMFWIPSNLWEWCRIKTLNQPSVRRFFNIPQQRELPKIVAESW
jgi:membrane protein insertase Oxa1/YidC/SpoIIIJ